MLLITRVIGRMKCNRDDGDKDEGTRTGSVARSILMQHNVCSYKTSNFQTGCPFKNVDGPQLH